MYIYIYIYSTCICMYVCRLIVYWKHPQTVIKKNLNSDLGIVFLCLLGLVQDGSAATWDDDGAYCKPNQYHLIIWQI